MKQGCKQSPFRNNIALVRYKKRLTELRKELLFKINLRQYTSFIFAGLVNTALGFFAFICLIYLLGVNVWLSNLSAVLASTISGYFLSKNFVFKTSSRGDWALYLAFTVFQYFIYTNIIIFLENFGITYALGYIFVVFFQTLVSFYFQKKVVFKIK